MSVGKFLILGKGERVWQEMLDQAGLKPGDRVLDVGCGPGSLTLLAKKRVGEAGQVAGIDASPEMIAVAEEKAQRAGLQVDYRLEVVERLPFSDSSFDAVLSSLMVHHLPLDLKRQALAEILRVLKPGGCLVILDMKRPESWLNGALLHLTHHRGMRIGVQDLEPYLREAGFGGIELVDTRARMLGLLRGRKP
jgi:ubiquinone/menaquinone biosynthesis C-methylase UbiE